MKNFASIKTSLSKSNRNKSTHRNKLLVSKGIAKKKKKGMAKICLKSPKKSNCSVLNFMLMG